MARSKATGFYQNKDGTWAIDTKVKVDGVYRHFSKNGYPTLSAAKTDLERAKAEFIMSKSKKRSEVVMFDELLNEYEKMRKIIVDQSTLECDRSAFNVYMLPYFGKCRLKDVFTGDSIYNWYHELVDTPKYSNNKKSKIITRMKDLLKFAYMHKYIDAEVYQDCDVNLYQVKYSKKPATERIVWEAYEEKAFIDAISINKRDSLMFRLFLATSPRLGEFLALQPQCFDENKCKITICQQVKNISGKGSVLTDKLKTHESYRTIIISKELSKELSDYIKDFGINENQFLWYSHTKNKPMSRNSIRRLFEKYCKIAKVRVMNLHALRHNQAVKLASVCKTGEEIEVAARRLGHSPSMFLNTYANHKNDDAELEILERVAQA